MVEFGNLWYFFFIILGAAIILILYFLLRNKSKKTIFIVLGSLLILNLLIHFLKLYIPPYNLDINFAVRELWFINVCGISVITFPIYFFGKNKTMKDFMFYLGVLSGFLAFVIPTEALGKSVATLDLWRFYICHLIIILVPLLMVVLKVHEIDYKKIWKMPFCVIMTLMFIMVQQVIQAELGIVNLRNDNFYNINFVNPSLFWQPGDEPLAKIFTIFTFDFLKVVPFGINKGEPKYWPLFYMVPGIIVYFSVFPFLIGLPWQGKRFFNDIGNFLRIGNKKSKRNISKAKYKHK